MSLLLEISIRAGLIAFAVAAVIYALRIASATARHIAWCGVLAAMLLLPALSTWGPKATLHVIPVEPVVPIVESWTPEPVSVGPVTPVIAAPARSTPWHPDPLLSAYLCITAFFLLRLLLGTLRAARLRSRATVEPAFLSSSDCACPVTVGWRHPSVILPAHWRTWSQAELDAVLAHEREHARRRDPLVQWIAALNRCVFWFHPLAWWLEHCLAGLAEEACDAAAIARGHDPRDYSEYLLHQARAIKQAGSRLAFAGPTMGRGDLQQRIRRLLDACPAPAPTRARSAAAIALCTAAIVAFTGCQLGRVEKAQSGQPTMNELARKRAEKNNQFQTKDAELKQRVASLTPAGAESLLAELKQNTQDSEKYWTLVRYYEAHADVKGVVALRLYYIEHAPDGQVWPGNIDPRMDRAGYDRGKALWLAHLKQPQPHPEIYNRAVDFLEGDDKPLAGQILEDFRKAFPNDARVPTQFGRHCAQVLLGSAEPLTEYNVFRAVSTQAAQSAYAQEVRAKLSQSNDAPVLAQTTQWLVSWGMPSAHHKIAAELARMCADRALAADPKNLLAQTMRNRLDMFEIADRLRKLSKMTPAELANISAGDRMAMLWTELNTAARDQDHPEDVATKAHALLDLAARNPADPLYGDAIYDANILLGKVSLWAGDKEAAARYLLAAAETPGSGRIREHFEMNLPRALVDWGKRSTVADFLDKMAPKTLRAKELHDWAAQIRKGINPDLIPTYSYTGCHKGPC